MPKPPSPRLVLRTRPDGAHVLFTKNLGLLRRRLGPEVLNCFVCCFIQAERVDSLLAFLHLNLTHLRHGSEQHSRNYLAASVFLMGTLFELSLAMDRLRSVLIRRKLIEKEEWTRRIGARWDSHWRNSQAVSAFRSKAAFHVDPSFIEAGLDALPQSRRIDIFRFASEHRQDGMFVLGVEALLNGLPKSGSRVNDLMIEAIPDLNVYEPLTQLFLATLDRIGLTPKVEPREA